MIVSNIRIARILLKTTKNTNNSNKKIFHSTKKKEENNNKKKQENSKPLSISIVKSICHTTYEQIIVNCQRTNKTKHTYVSTN